MISPETFEEHAKEYQPSAPRPARLSVGSVAVPVGASIADVVLGLSRWFRRWELVMVACAITGLTLVALLPIWAVRFLPLQDYPLHLLREFIITHYSDPALHYHDTFVVSLFPIPYNLCDYIVAGINLLLPITTAGKLLLSIYVVLLPLSLWYALRSVDPGKTVLVPAGFLLTYNWYFAKGMTSNLIALPFFLFAMGYWWRHRLNPTWKHHLGLAALVFCVYLAHLYGFLLLFFSLVVLALLTLRKWSAVWRVLLAFVPSLLLLGTTFVLQMPLLQHDPDPLVIEYPSLKARLAMVLTPRLDLPYFTTISPWREQRFLLAAGLLLGGLAFVHWRALLRNAFSGLFVALFLLYLSMPEFLSPKGQLYFSIRVLIFVCLVGLFCIEVPTQPLARACTLGVLVLLSLYALQGTLRDYREIGRGLDDYYAALENIPSGERVSFRVDPGAMYIGNITPYAFFGGYYYIERGEGKTPPGLEGCCAGLMRSVRYRIPEPQQSPPLEASMARRAVDVGGYAIVLPRGQQVKVADLAQKYGFRPLLEIPKLDVYRKVRMVEGPNWFPGPYYIHGLKTNYNYLLIWSDRPSDPGVTKQFHLVFSQGKAQLWKRFHELGDDSPLELCIPCGDPQPAP